MIILVVIFGDICKEIENKILVEVFIGVEGMYIKGDKFYIKVEIMKKFFELLIKDFI